MRVTLGAALIAGASAASPWPPSARAQALAVLAKMNSTNKFTMVHGWGGAYVGDTPSITLSDGTVIPAIHEHDGPQGVANGNKDVTCWPAALTVVQTWDTELMYAYGAGMGLEQYKKGSNVMLGPGVNLARLPWNGARPGPHPRSALPLSPPLSYRLPCAPSSPQGATLSTRARTPGLLAKWWPPRCGGFRARTCRAA